jgi:O-acetylhomoserine (thiol)-lyase
MAAQTIALLNLAENGGHIVSSSSLYGGTYNQLHYTFPKLGVEVSFIDDPDDLDAWKAAIRPNTKAFYGESIGNPQNDVLDIDAVAEVAHENDVPLIIDNTVATPWLCRPLEHGADIVLHSATKFLNGHGTTIGGVIVDGGSFDFSASGRFPGFTEPDESYHGLAYWPALGPGSFIIKARVQLLRDMGMAVSPFNAFLTLAGLETLSLRMERHNDNARKVVEYLLAQPQVKKVNFPGNPASPWHAQANALFDGKGYGSVPSFIIEGGADAGKRFIEALELHYHVANMGDVRSLAIHPASTTHSQMSTEELERIGIEPGLVRLSVGLETLDDILADLDRGFAAAK